MISFQVCENCEHCTYEEGKFDEVGDLIFPPSVMCDLTGDILYMKDDPPDKCDYYLEHIMYSDGIPEEVARRLSGEE